MSIRIAIELEDYEAICKERDELKAKLAVAMAALLDSNNCCRCDICRDKSGKALEEIGEVK